MAAIKPNEVTIKQESAAVTIANAIEYAEAVVIHINKAIIELLHLHKVAIR